MGHLNVETSEDNSPGSPQEEVGAFLARHAFRFDFIEDGPVTDAELTAFVEAAPDLRSQAARFIARRVLEQVRTDAPRLALPDLQAALDAEGADPLRLARATGQPVGVVLRRLAAVPSLDAGLVVCDRSGTILFCKSVDGFTVPRHGACCPLWPLYTTLAQPGTIVATKVSQAGRTGPGFECFAVAEPVGSPRYNAAPDVQSMMLLVPAAPDGAEVTEVGSTCRVCPRGTCTSRREPSILSVGI